MDLLSPKVLVPAALFALLSPGLFPASTQTSFMMVATRAALLIIVYWALVKIGLIKAALTKADLLVPAVLFVLLSPGMLVKIPPGTFGGALTGGAASTSGAAIGVHTVVFIVLYSVLRKAFPGYY